MDSSILRALIIMLAAISLSACGGDDDNNAGPALQCGGATCNATTQYCVQTRVGSFDAPSSDFCLDKPSSCTSCNCVNVQADFEAQEDGAGNCASAVISCSSEDGAIRASCTRASGI